MEMFYPERVPFFVCVGRNYTAHIEEMRVEREKDPVIFFKPPSAISFKDEVIIPKDLGELHYEVEMTVLISKTAKNISMKQASSAIWGYGIGLDLTLRNMQAGFKKKGLPWGLSKGFDCSAPMGPFVKRSDMADMKGMRIRLEKNGKTVQSSPLDLMIFSPEAVISYVSRFMTLRKGYVIMTGTPAGVGPVENDDHFFAALGNISKMEIRIRR